MKLSYRMEVVEDQEKGRFMVSFPDLPGCMTCGETIETARDAKRERSLHRSLTEQAKREGVSMNLYCLYLLSRNDAVVSK